MNQAALAIDNQSIWGAEDELSVLTFSLNIFAVVLRSRSRARFHV